MNEDNIEFLMETDWITQEPIDFEHKKYVLLAYFKKVSEILEQNKIYPTFIELSLHLANIQTIIKEKMLLYTDKTFSSCDEELLVKDLLVKQLPEFTKEEDEEFDKIVKFSSSKFFEYFNIIKTYWSMIYETIAVSIKKNKKYMRDGYGYMSYNDKKSNKIYVWEYVIEPIASNSKDYETLVKLIYEGNKKDLSFVQIIENFSTMDEVKRKHGPVFEMKTSQEYPLDETLVPLFKRKLMSYVLQSVRIQTLKKYDA